MERDWEKSTIPSCIVEDGKMFPLATVVIVQMQSGQFCAWQPEYAIKEIANTMDEVVRKTATTMGLVLADPQFDYLTIRPDGTKEYYVPIPLLAEDYAEDLASLKELMEETFCIQAPDHLEDYYFVSVVPRFPNN